MMEGEQKIAAVAQCLSDQKVVSSNSKTGFELAP